MKILYITYGLPYPPHSGARLRDFHLINQVAVQHSVSVLSLLESPEERRYLSSLVHCCEQVDTVLAAAKSWARHLSGIAHALASGRPLATHLFHYPEMVARVRAIATTWNPDIVQIEHSFLAPYVRAIPDDHPGKTILSMHNLGALQYRRMLRLRTGIWQKLLFLFKWMLMRGWEPRWAAKFDHCLVVSPVEERLLRAAVPNLPVSVIDNGADTESRRRLPPPPGGNALLFVGTMGYPPNADAVLHFHRAIMPRLRRRIPDVELIVVGRHPPPAVRRLDQQPDVTVTGYVNDLIPWYQRSRITVVPLRAGGGTRLKILESMALGRPVVSTSLGCEGLEVSDCEHILVADNPAEFADAVIRLIEDEELYRRMISSARQRVETRYAWAEIARKLLAVYEGMAG